MREQSNGIKPLVIAEYLKTALPTISRKEIGTLLAAYSEHWRTYHNLYHIYRMVKSAETHFKSECDDDEWRALLTMILYHDAVYKVGDAGKDNERASADMMADLIGTMDVTLWFELCAWAGIYATKTHNLDGVPEQYQKIVAMIIDLDLEGIGLTDEGFTQNTEAIWLEFQPIMIREKFDRGREEWARSFLSRPHIFHTELFREKYELQARRNLEHLLK